MLKVCLLSRLNLDQGILVCPHGERGGEKVVHDEGTVEVEGVVGEGGKGEGGLLAVLIRLELCLVVCV